MKFSKHVSLILALLFIVACGSLSRPLGDEMELTEAQDHHLPGKWKLIGPDLPFCEKFEIKKNDDEWSFQRHRDKSGALKFTQYDKTQMATVPVSHGRRTLLLPVEICHVSHDSLWVRPVHFYRFSHVLRKGELPSNDAQKQVFSGSDEAFFEYSQQKRELFYKTFLYRKVEDYDQKICVGRDKILGQEIDPKKRFLFDIEGDWVRADGNAIHFIDTFSLPRIKKRAEVLAMEKHRHHRDIVLTEYNGNIFLNIEILQDRANRYVLALVSRVSESEMEIREVDLTYYNGNLDKYNRCIDDDEAVIAYMTRRPTSILHKRLYKKEFDKLAYKKDEEVILQIINALSVKDRVALSKMISYPLKRMYPLPSIKNEKEFIQRFDQVFDERIRKDIVSSNVESDWEPVGWRGIMFARGALWLNYHGQIRSVNHQTEIEAKMLRSIIAHQKKVVHASVNVFKSPCLDWVTKKHRVRVDLMDDGTYRYASWSLSKKISDKPDLVLQNGQCVFQGSGGNHGYYFKNGDYEYRCEVQIIGKDDIPGWVEIRKNDKVLGEYQVEKVTDKWD